MTHNPLPSEINRAVELKYKGLGASVQQAQDLLDRGDYRAAQRKAEEAALAYDDPPSVQRILGEALLRQGQSSEALKAFKKVNSSQNDSASYARIGLLRLRLGDVAGSRAMLKDELVIGFLSPNALGAIPAVRDARTLEGAWLFVIGLMDDIQASDADAAFYYNQALGVFPKNSLLNYNLGKMHLRQRRYQLAADAFVIARDNGRGDLKDQAAREFETAYHLSKAPAPTPYIPQVRSHVL